MDNKEYLINIFYEGHKDYWRDLLEDVASEENYNKEWLEHQYNLLWDRAEVHVNEMTPEEFKEYFWVD